MDRIRSYGRNTFASLNIRNYRLYFIGQALSLCGTWMQTVAQGWIVLDLTGSGTQLGGVLAFQFLPILFLGPWGGVITDRFNKRTLLYATQVFSGLLALILGVLVVTDVVAIWMIYLLALGLGLIKVIDNPARQTFVNEMVPPSSVRNAVTLNSTAANLARVVGPAIGGVLIALFGIAFCFFVNAFSYIAVIVMLALMHEKELHAQPTVTKGPGQLMEGFRYVRHTPLIRNLLILILIIGTFAYEFQVSLPLLAKVTFLGTAADYAALLAAFGMGSVIGGLVSAGRKKFSPQALSVSTLAFGGSMLLVAVMPSLGFATLGMVLVGFFSILVTSLANTMIQLESEPAMRGRVMALWSVAFFGTTPFGGPLVGWVGEYLGPRWGVAIGGLAALLAGLFIHKVLRFETENIPETIRMESERENSKDDLKLA